MTLGNVLDEMSKRQRPAEELPSINTEEFRKVVQTRRSIRVFDGTPIPQDIVRDCLELALLAPNSSNLQCWEFYWVKTPETKLKLVEACLSQPAAKTAAELIVCVARLKIWKDHQQRMLQGLKQNPHVPKSALDYYGKIVPMMYNQGPLGLFGIIKKIGLFFRGIAKPTPREPSSIADMRVWAVKSCSLACENLMLAFRAYGFDTCPMEGLDSTRVKKILNLPSDAEVVMTIGAGKRAPQGVYGSRFRFDSNDIIKEV